MTGAGLEPTPHPELSSELEVSEDALAAPQLASEEGMEVVGEGDRARRPIFAQPEAVAEVGAEVLPPDEETLGIFADVLSGEVGEGGATRERVAGGARGGGSRARDE